MITPKEDQTVEKNEHKISGTNWKKEVRFKSKSISNYIKYK